MTTGSSSRRIAPWYGLTWDTSAGHCCPVGALNVLYDKLWLYYNLFQPVMHLVGKQVVNRKLRRKHDLAKTPYQRLLSTGVLSPEKETQLKELYAQTIRVVCTPRYTRAGKALGKS